jgi:hypothetical protein
MSARIKKQKKARRTKIEARLESRVEESGHGLIFHGRTAMCRRNEAVTAAKSFFSVQLSTVLLLLVLLSLLYFLSSIKYVSGAHGGLRMEWRHWSTTALASWAARRRRSSCWRAAAAGASSTSHRRAPAAPRSRCGRSSSTCSARTVLTPPMSSSTARRCVDPSPPSSTARWCSTPGRTSATCSSCSTEDSSSTISGPPPSAPRRRLPRWGDGFHGKTTARRQPPCGQCLNDDQRRSAAA